MTKIVINTCFGGFGLSEEAIALYFKKAGLVRHVEPSAFGNRYNYIKRGEKKTFWPVSDLKRDDPILVEIIEILGEAVNALYANLKIVEIPDNVLWEIDSYDGVEYIVEKHRTWR